MNCFESHQVVADLHDVKFLLSHEAQRNLYRYSIRGVTTPPFYFLYMCPHRIRLAAAPPATTRLTSTREDPLYLTCQLFVTYTILSPCYLVRFLLHA